MMREQRSKLSARCLRKHGSGGKVRSEAILTSLCFSNMHFNLPLRSEIQKSHQNIKGRLVDVDISLHTGIDA